MEIDKVLHEIVNIYQRTFGAIANDDRYQIKSHRVFPSRVFKSRPPFIEDAGYSDGYFLQVDAIFGDRPWPEVSKMVRFYFSEGRLIWIAGDWRDEMLFFHMEGGWRNLSGESISRPYPQGLELEQMAKAIQTFLDSGNA